VGLQLCNSWFIHSLHSFSSFAFSLCSFSFASLIHCYYLGSPPYRSFVRSFAIHRHTHLVRYPHSLLGLGPLDDPNARLDTILDVCLLRNVLLRYCIFEYCTVCCIRISLGPRIVPFTIDSIALHTICGCNHQPFRLYWWNPSCFWKQQQQPQT
jgi:hypothetical protein